MSSDSFIIALSYMRFTEFLALQTAKQILGSVPAGQDDRVPM